MTSPVRNSLLEAFVTTLTTTRPTARPANHPVGRTGHRAQTRTAVVGAPQPRIAGPWAQRRPAPAGRVQAQRTPLAPRVVVELRCSDPLLRAGLEEVLAGHPRVRLAGDGEARTAEVDGQRVILLATERFRPDMLPTAAPGTDARVPTVLIIPALDEHELLAALDAGVNAVLTPDAAADRTRLAAAIIAVSEGRAQLPSDLQGLLVAQVRRLNKDVLQPNGLTLSGLTARECDVLRLIAEGLDTAEIGRRLAFSERTVKYVLTGVETRFNLRSRAHAVAFAVRLGAI